jgi:hypothetical protein
MPGQPNSVVTAQNVSGTPGDAIPLAVTVSTNPGQSMGSAYLLGLPKSARLTDTSHAVTVEDEKAVIDVTNWDLPQLSVTLLPAQAGTYTLAVVAVSRPDNGEPMNFTRSAFTLDATTESRKPATATEPARPDEAVVREARRPPAAAPPLAKPPAVDAVRIGGTTPKVTAPATEVFIPQAPASLYREQAPRAAPPLPSVAAPSPAAVRPTETRPAALAAPPAAAPGVAAPPGASPAAAPALAAPAAASAARAVEADGKALVERAERLIRLGDISGARLVLERASDRGDPRATFLLAQTCDPRMLRAWNVQGLRPDPDRARALYAKAAQEGLREAKPMADAMR